MSYRSSPSQISWEFSCPKFVDFSNPKTFNLNTEADRYFESEHEFDSSFTVAGNLSELMKVDTLFAEKDLMASPYISPRKDSPSPDTYQTPNGSKDDIESDEVFYTTRKSYSFRETESRRLTLLGKSPYRIPGGTPSVRRSKRTPFSSKPLEKNHKDHDDEELLVENTVKVLFTEETEDQELLEAKLLQDSQSIRTKNLSFNKYITVIEEESKENDDEDKIASHENDIPNTDEKDIQMNNQERDEKNTQTTEQDKYQENEQEKNPEVDCEPGISNCITEVSCQGISIALNFSDEEVKDSFLSNEKACEDKAYESYETNEKEKSAKESIEKTDEKEIVNLNENLADLKLSESKLGNDEIIINSQQDHQEKVIESECYDIEIPVIVVHNLIVENTENMNETISPKKPSNEQLTPPGVHSDGTDAWTDVDEENKPANCENVTKQKRQLRRTSYIKTTASVLSTAKKVDPQSRLHRLLSYTAPPRNKFRSLAELSKGFETSTRVYTPPTRKPSKSHWTPTKPISPKLTACKRKRTVTCISAKEQEEIIAKSIKKNTFKATPFNKKAYESLVNIGVKRVDPRPITKPRPFSFQIDKRIEARKSKAACDLQTIFNKPQAVAKPCPK